MKDVGGEIKGWPAPRTGRSTQSRERGIAFNIAAASSGQVLLCMKRENIREQRFDPAGGKKSGGGDRTTRPVYVPVRAVIDSILPISSGTIVIPCSCNRA